MTFFSCFSVGKESTSLEGEHTFGKKHWPHVCAPHMYKHDFFWGIFYFYLQGTSK
jgi:hypothetical protein